MTKFFDNLLSALLTTVYGKDMRKLIHDAFQEIGETMLVPANVDAASSIGTLTQEDKAIYPKTVPEAIVDTSGKNTGKALVIGSDGKAHPSDTSALTQEDKELILSLLENAVYLSTDAKAKYTTLHDKWMKG